MRIEFSSNNLRINSKFCTPRVCNQSMEKLLFTKRRFPFVYVLEKV